MKKWYKSKTLWVALFTLVATVLMDGFGVEVPAYYQTAFLSVVMVALRIITKEPIKF